MKETKVSQRFGLSVESIEQDKLSSRLRQISHQGPALQSHAELLAKTQRLLDTVTYLEDELQIIEQDQVRQAVILRSKIPHQHAQSLSYYEICLQQDGLTLIQQPVYHSQRTETQLGDFVLSDRLLERLGQDFQKIIK